jgi:hypothetical protein
MAVYIFDGHKDEQAVTFVGATLADREKNYHDDSDFYALVWDEAEGSCYAVHYATTRCATDPRNRAVVDATPEVLEKVGSWARKQLTRSITEQEELSSKWPRLHKRVVSISKRSKKFPLGMEGYCSDAYTDGYGNSVVDIDRADGVRVYGVNVSQLAVVEPESYVPTADEIEKRAAAMVARYGPEWAAVVICNGGRMPLA